MVIPSRWLAGGTGLDEFRADDARRQAHAQRSSTIRSSTRSSPASRFGGGISLLPLGPRHITGLCECRLSRDGRPTGRTVARYLDAYDVLIRDNEAVPILQKVRR